MVEELQVFDQEPVESLVLSQSKVVRWAARTSLHAPCSTSVSLSLCLRSWPPVIGQLRTPSFSSFEFPPREFPEVKDLRRRNPLSEGSHIEPVLL